MVYCWYKIIVLEYTQKGKTECQNRAFNCKETNKFLRFSWHSHANHNAQTSVLFYVHCSVQVAEYFLKILGFYL